MAVVFNYTPHEAQMAIHRARDRRFRTVCTGRRFGKTLCLAADPAPEIAMAITVRGKAAG